MPRVALPRRIEADHERAGWFMLGLASICDERRQDKGIMARLLEGLGRVGRILLLEQGRVS
jgi:hypothetical protein